MLHDGEKVFHAALIKIKLLEFGVSKALFINLNVANVSTP